MNLGACRKLAHSPETGTWYRAVKLAHHTTPINTAHTKATPSRFSAGPFPSASVRERPTQAAKDRRNNNFPKWRASLAPLSPVLGGEGLGVRGQHRVGVCRSPLTPDPSPPSTGERGARRSARLREVVVVSVLSSSRLNDHRLLPSRAVEASPDRRCSISTSVQTLADSPGRPPAIQSGAGSRCCPRPH